MAENSTQDTASTRAATKNVLKFPKPRKRGRKAGPKVGIPAAAIVSFTPRPPMPCEDTIGLLEMFLSKAKRGDITGAVILTVRADGDGLWYGEGGTAKTETMRYAAGLTKVAALLMGREAGGDHGSE